MIESLKSLYTRDLNKLRAEILSYNNEKIIWSVDKNISNSAGNLCLHLVGNLNHFIGTVLGNSGYVRNRDLEFSLKNIPRPELIEKIDRTLDIVTKTLDKLDEDDLKKEYPLVVFESKMSTEYFLIHLLSHLDYHLGQINYHRRLLDN
ncbi:DinB family protein [Chryseobacterium daecheongense]|uniref:DUF1572 domain-containing protein n=1 Tax=Chryseobacterium daecheongense TaxID=192389 RepID=A0A3N0VVU8_9FLAO|nr:DUF1572 family protein [Chryseobacterium daecheongense]ROH96018.1 DUF1572 domain-containing protein [Chryseobacterium daecheongense]TDX91577.1 uncharacterized protein DUF1572 [Chryseobacterium daecheongense]